MTELFLRRSSTVKFYAPFYFNCNECGAPIVHGWERRAGYCDACRSKLLKEGRLPAEVVILEAGQAAEAMAQARRRYAKRPSEKARRTWRTTS